MTWSNPSWLLALVAVPAAVALFWWAAARRRDALRRFAGLEGDAYAEGLARRRRWQAALLTGAVFFVAVALAGPRYGTQLREVQQDGLDVIVALDVSDSMRAEDVAPSRLDRAKLEVERLLPELRGSRVGLVLFAGDAFLQAPLTTDFGAVRLFLDAADPTLVPTQGTDFGQALRVALRAFDVQGETPADERARALLIVSDGEDHGAGLGPALDAAAEQGVALFAAGVGTDEGGPIPVYRQGRLAGYKTDRNGETVTTRFDDRSLRDVGRDGYFRIGRTTSDLADITAPLGRLERGTFASEQFESFAEQFQWPLGLALLLLLAERALAARREPAPVAA